MFVRATCSRMGKRKERSSTRDRTRLGKKLVLLVQVIVNPPGKHPMGGFSRAKACFCCIKVMDSPENKPHKVSTAKQETREMPKNKTPQPC